ncbi:MAG TPA: hypothetical protein VN026_15300 [Bacteroidia bacterium]|nr:hypothetical protein [Bacteroidia bacterium]
MKINKHTLFSAFFLFIFLSAFSSAAYTSLRSSLKEFPHFSKHKELKEDGTLSSSENLAFEENENDCEESMNPEFSFLTTFLSFDFLGTTSKNNFTNLPYSDKTSDSIFLSIRVLRI